MMKIKLLLIICLLGSKIWAVGEAGAIFLLIAPGAGPAGTGEAQVAQVNDAYASYYNPAGLGFLTGKEVVGMHVNWLPNLASDLFYEFIAYRHYIDGLGSIGGHIIFLNLGEQIGMDEQGNPTTNWTSFMAAGAGSFGTQLSETSSIGFNFKIFHQKLSDFTTGSEEGQGYSTDFGFDIGYLKKFKLSAESIRIKNKKKLNHLFDQLTDLYNRQSTLYDQMSALFGSEDDIYELIEEQIYLREDLEGVKSKLLRYNNMENFIILDDKLLSIITDMNSLIDSFSEIQGDTTFLSTFNTIDDPKLFLMERILFNLLETEAIRGNFLSEVESEEIQDIDDRFNFGFSISNIGPTIDFVDVDQADPSPTNMRIGIMAQLYNDDFNKINFLFDANKLLVTRYQMMDWDGDGLVGQYNEFGDFDFVGDYNAKGNKEYDSKHYIDDPWYLAIFTAWLDDWYLGGDVDHSGDRKIGGWTCNGNITKESLEYYLCDGDWESTFDLEFSDVHYGIYGEPKGSTKKAQKEKGTGDDRSIKTEIDEMIYNMGLEYWYTDAFALRIGYINDIEGKIFNPTFGAGIRLLQYGFDFGYTAGEEGHPRANTMFFSVNIKL